MATATLLHAPAAAAATTPAATADGGERGGATADDTLTAQLSSRFFRPGGAVRGVVQLRSRGEVALVSARVHAHVTVDSNLLTLPLVSLWPAHKQQSPHQQQSPQQTERRDDQQLDAAAVDVQRFAGDAGACIFQSVPTTLLSDVNLVSSGGDGAAAVDTDSATTTTAKALATKYCEREFALALPASACPSFRGAAARVFYVLTITAQAARAGSRSVAVHLPFEVYAPEFYFQPSTLESADEYAAAQLAERAAVAASGRSDGSGNSSNNNSVGDNSSSNNSVGDSSSSSSSPRTPGARKQRSVSVGALPVGVRKGNEIPFELRPSLMHGRVETELAHKAQTSIFTIGKDNSHLVRFLLTKQSYQPGEVLLGVFDFARAALPCYEVSATLCFEETLSTMSLDPSRVVSAREVAAFHEYTGAALHTNVQFCIPHDALPTIRTDLVCFQWLLRFEFTAGVAASSSSSSATSSKASASLTAAAAGVSSSSAASSGANGAAGGNSGGASSGVAMQRQTFRWQVPIVVRPAPATERSRFANVPHKLFTGSKRSVRLV